MKKIKSIHQLKAEKRRIKERQAELEENLQSNWSALKESLRPVNIAKDTLSSLMKRKTADNLFGDGFVKNAVKVGLSLLANKFLNKVGSKWGRGAGKGT